MAKPKTAEGAPFLERVAALPDQLPGGCTIVGSYAPRGLNSATPSIMVVETDKDDDSDWTSYQRSIETKLFKADVLDIKD